MSTRVMGVKVVGIVAWLTSFLFAQSAELWPAIQQRGTLRWGGDSEGGAPYSFFDPKDPDRLIGFEVEFAAALAAKLGVKSEFVQNNWDMLVPALEDGSKFDVIIAGLERTPENLAKIAMSRPYFVYGQQLVVRADATNVSSLADLKGRAVGVLSASASHRIAESQGNLEVRVYADNVNYFRELEVGRLEAVLTDTPIAEVNLAANPTLKKAGPPSSPGYYAVGLRREDRELLAHIDEAINALIADGTLQRIYTKYGLWGPEQAELADWKDDGGPIRERRSVWRDWRIYLPMLLKASVTTIWVTCGGMALAVTLGLVLAVGRLFGPRLIRWLAVAYIEIFRGTPLLLQIYFIYFGLAQQLGLKLTAGVAAVLALGLNYAANEAENYRGGIQGVPRGQMDAALALGMSRRLALRRVILPQALRISLPSITNDFIAMFKDSSIVSVIALVELTKEYQIRAIDTGDYIGLGLMTAGIYFAISYTASLGARRLERRLHRDSR
ncbi:MAG TPA: ABC transporter substrate-binding protein/permease [Verrucomicrobiota bacterium]|nr:ABC transporter substrate-binding protein/permease [Verrucomicrobiota bacterium]